MSSDQFVTLLIAKSADEAEYYQTLLEDHDIEVVIDEDYVDSEGGIAVMVLDDSLEDAQHILEQHETIDDEFTLDDDLEDEEDEEDEFDGYEEIKEDVLAVDDDDDDDDDDFDDGDDEDADEAFLGDDDEDY